MYRGKKGSTLIHEPGANRDEILVPFLAIVIYHWNHKLKIE